MINWENPLIAPYRQQLLSTEKPVVRIKLSPANKSSLRRWDSKIGGAPYLPLGAEYPHTANGDPLTLLAQINFAQTPPLENFPRQGLLQFFIHSDDLYGCDLDNLLNNDGFRVIYHADVVEDDSLQQSDYPHYYGEEFGLPHNPEQSFAMSFEQGTQLVSCSDYRFAQILERYEGGKNENFWQIHSNEDLEYEIMESFSGGHQIGGYPDFTQNDPREEHDELKDYILLFQLQSEWEDGIEIIWGDLGVGGFLIHPDDLAKLDFSKVAYSWDCS